jgi:hypothetical protein
VNIRSPYMNTTEIAVFLRFLKGDGSPNEKQARRWLDQSRIPTKFAGRSVLARTEDVDAALKTRKDFDGAARRLRRAV